MTFKRLTVVTVLFAASALTLRGAPATHRAHLSDDLVRHVARHTKARARVIVRGDQATVDDIAARHHLQVVRHMAHAAVLAANSDEMAELAADAGVENLSGDVLDGIEWAVNNRQTYNIRVINLSLGHPVFESSTTDPLCLAVADAVNAGIVVVASAGNAGKSADGHMILGGITSPGNSPLALTVGALNTWGTVKRTDDSVATSG